MKVQAALFALHICKEHYGYEFLISQGAERACAGWAV